MISTRHTWYTFRRRKTRVVLNKAMPNIYCFIKRTTFTPHCLIDQWIREGRCCDFVIYSVLMFNPVIITLMTVVRRHPMKKLGMYAWDIQNCHSLVEHHHQPQLSAPKHTPFQTLHTTDLSSGSPPSEWRAAPAFLFHVMKSSLAISLGWRPDDS